MIKNNYETPSLFYTDFQEGFVLCASLYDSMGSLGSENITDSGNSVIWE